LHLDYEPISNDPILLERTESREDRETKTSDDLVAQALISLSSLDSYLEFLAALEDEEDKLASLYM
jgi:hypothetical protein